MHWSYVVWPILGFIGLYILVGIILRITGGYAPGWQVRCRRCGATRDGAEIGMVRIGKVRQIRTGTFGWCNSCRGLRTFAVEPKPEAGQ